MSKASTEIWGRHRDEDDDVAFLSSDNVQKHK
jgi:hypothetical protein